MSRAQPGVDVEAVGLVADGDHLGAELVEHRWRDVVARAVRAVDDDPQSAQVELGRKGALAELDVAARCIVDPPCLAELGRRDAEQRRVHRRLDGMLDRVRQLQSTGREELDAVVVERIVRRADDDAGGQPQRARQIGDARCGQRPGQMDVDPRRRQPGLERRFEHVAGNPRVLADQDRGPPAGVARLLGEHAPGRPTELQHELRRDGHGADAPANSVRAEVFSLSFELSLFNGPVQGGVPDSTARHTFNASTVARTS